MKNFRLYNVLDEYVNYLRQFDNKVQQKCNEYENIKQTLTETLVQTATIKENQ